MIEILTLFLAVYGALAAPHGELATSQDLPTTSGNDAVRVATLPGVDNLGEKSLPISRLYAQRQREEPERELPGTGNLAERAQIRRELPGTRNLDEKAIPDYVIRKMSVES